MASPITIFKNNELLFEASNIQEAARYLAEHLNTTKYRSFVYHQDAPVFQAPEHN